MEFVCVRLHKTVPASSRLNLHEGCRGKNKSATEVLAASLSAVKFSSWTATLKERMKLMVCDRKSHKDLSYSSGVDFDSISGTSTCLRFSAILRTSSKLSFDTTSASMTEDSPSFFGASA